ncbi:MAG: hypothetical protein GXO19_01535 [Epsilonproteobacteria bacterium]|nr:hypothetical protein [Campylobacterota bacterium]NPA56397.1 hypothetical protein [Campylobacterota bacterium]
MQFEELEKKCKKYYRRKRLKKVFLFLLFTLPLLSLFLPERVGSLLSLSSGVPGKESSSPPPLSSSSSSSSSSLPSQCYLLQLFYAHDTFRHEVERYQKRLEKLGFQNCFISQGKTLSNGTRQLFLYCNMVEERRDLRPAIRLAKYHNLDYLVQKLPCDREKIVRTPERSNPPRRKRGVDPYQQAYQKALDYFYKENYQKAMEWAERANNIDKSKEEAWLLYAQSLYLLGRVEEAIYLLETYLKYRDSSKARKLLKSFSEG